MTDQEKLLLGGGLAAVFAAAFLAKKAAPEIGEVAQFIAKFGPIDKQVSAEAGWPPGILTAWAAMESGWGTSELAAKYNNLFGIKASQAWLADHKPVVPLPTREYEGTSHVEHIIAPFKAYPNWTASAQDLVYTITQQPTTAPLYKGAADALDRGDISGFLAAITASPYSTAANYGDRILSTLKTVANTQIA